MLAMAAIFFPVCPAHAYPEEDRILDDTVYASDFGAVPDDGKDDTKTLRHAAGYCREHPGCTLALPPGVYILKDSLAEKLESEVMSGTMGQNPEETIFSPYYPYVRGLDFSGYDSVTVEAAATVLMCTGWMEPVSVAGCRNFTLKGITVDYMRKHFSEGTIVEVNPDNILVKSRDPDKLDEGTPLPRLMIWDSMKNGMFSEAFYFPEHQFCEDGTVRFNIGIPSYLKGEKVAVPHSLSDDGWMTLELESPTFTHSQTADVPSIGDIVEITEKSTQVKIRIDRKLPGDFHDYYVFNTSKHPELEFRNSAVWGNLSRGVLVKTRNVMIEKNIFIGCTGTAVHIGAESWWKESVHAWLPQQ